MGIKGVKANILDDLGSYSRAETFMMPALTAFDAPFRLEAGFYASNGYRALQAMEQSGFDLDSIGGLAQVTWNGIFTRCYVSVPERGVPYLTTSTMMESRPAPTAFLSLKNTKDLAQHRVRSGEVLVSCSGSIGNVAICTTDIDGSAVTPDAIRITANTPSDAELVYCFLKSEVGQFLLRRGKSGSVVDHLYVDDICNMAIPKLPKQLREELTTLIRRACDLRVQSNRLLDEVQRELQRSLYLPDISEFSSHMQLDKVGEATAFVVDSRDRFAEGLPFGELRLDAGYHSPAAVALRRHILSRDNGVELRKLLEDVRDSSLRKRIYVETEENGVPLMGGRQLMQLRPSGLSYLSKSLTKKLNHEKVNEGWILITSGGTLGRTSYVHRNYEGWVFSQDVMRLIPNLDEICPGFIYAFMASPYGQMQITQRGYGSVIPRLRAFQIGSIAILLPQDKGKSIHVKVVQAFDARADARDSEDKAISLFTDAISNGREATESEWGQEY